MKIGLSLSLCVSDMLAKGISPAQVDYIICGTKFANEEAFLRVCDAYKTLYWRRDADAAQRIADSFFYAGKLLQPRLIGGTAPNTGDGIWLEAQS